MDLGLLGFEGIRAVFNLHPMFVHFPLALLPSALLLYCLGTVMKKPSLLVAGRACLYLGAAGALLTVATGLSARDSFPHNDTVHHIMQTHQVIGIAILVLCIVLVGWSFWESDQRPRGVWGFLGALFVTVLLDLQNGDLGARMVFVEGAAVKPAVSAITSGEGANETEHVHGAEKEMDMQMNHDHTHPAEP